MAQSPENRMLENEADALITLGVLLRRNRPPRLQHEVEQILRSGLSSSRKISAIRRLDAGHREPVNPAAKAASAHRTDSRSPAETRAAEDTAAKRQPQKQQAPQPARVRQQTEENPESGNTEEALPDYRERVQDAGIEENRARLKRLPDRAPLLRFILSEYSRLRRFGRDRRILSPRLFPPGVRLNRDAAAALEAALKPAVFRLLEILQPALTDGWLILSKRSYNLLETLRELCRAIEAIDFPSLQLEDPDLIDRLERVEVPFLVLRSDPEYPALLTAAFRSLAGSTRTADRRYPDAPELIRRLLGDDGTLPSLRDFLMGLNMVRSRSMLDPEEIVDPDVGPLVDTVRFRCDPPVGVRIDEHVRKALARLAVLRGQVREILRIRTFLEPAPGERAEDLLADLYDSGSIRMPSGRRFQTDRQNVTLFLSGFLESFLSTYEGILDGEVTVVSGASGRLFEPALFGREILRLRQLAQRFRRLSYTVPGFSLSRFLHLSASGIGASGAESEIILFVQETAAILREIARRLSVILARRIRSGTDDPSPAPPINGMILQGRPARLHLENGRLAAPPFLRGRQVTEALTMAISICYGFCREVQDRPFSALLKRERGAAAELRGILNLLERIAPPETYLQVKGLEP